MLEPPCISLDSLQGHTLSFDKYVTLTYMHYHNQGIALLPTAGTPTPNSLRSSWDLLPGRSTNMLASSTLSTFVVLEGGLDDKLSPQILF